MRLIKGSLAGLVLAGILAMMPAAVFARGGGGGGGHGGGGGGGGHGGGGGGHGFGGGGGGHAFVGGGHAFSGFSGRGFSPGFNGMRGFSTSRFSGRGDRGRLGDRGHDRDFHDRRFRDFDGEPFDFGGTGFGYPDYAYYYPYSYYNNNGYLSVARAVQDELAKLGYYHGQIDGIVGPETRKAIRWFQSVDKLSITGKIDDPTLKALQIS